MAVFLWKINTPDFLLNDIRKYFMFCIPAVFLFWILFSNIIAGLSKLDPVKVMKKNADAYMALCLLLFCLFSDIGKFEPYQNAQYKYFLNILVAVAGFSSFIFMKILLCPLDIAKLKSDFLKVNLQGDNCFFNGKILVYAGTVITAYIFASFLLTSYITFSDQYINACSATKLWNLIFAESVTTINDPSLHLNIWGMHIIPVIFFLCPVYFLLPHIEILMIFQALLLASGAIPLYFIAKGKLRSETLALAIAFAYLFNPLLHFMNTTGVVYDHFPIAFLLFSFYFFEVRNKPLFWVFIVLSLMCKEPVALIVIMYGIYIYIKTKDKKDGVYLAVLGISWLIVSVLIIQSLNKGSNNSDFMSNKMPYFMSHPVSLVRFLLQPKLVASFILLLFPLGYAGVFSSFWLVSVPYMVLHLLYEGFSNLRTFYTSPAIPVFMLAAVYGITKILGMSFFKRNRNGRYAVAGYIFSCALFSFIFMNPYEYIKVFNPDWLNIRKHNLIARDLIKKIPPGSSVSASVEYHSYFCNRREIFQFPQYPSKKFSKIFNEPSYRFSEVRDADYVVLDIKQPYGGKFCGYNNPKIQKVLNNRDYGVYAYRDGILIFKRGYDYDKGLFNLALTREPQVQYKVDMVLNDEIKLLGYSTEKNNVYQGDTLFITFFWECLADIKEDYTFLITFVREDSEDINIYHMPVEGLYPTSEWLKGDIIRDEISIEIDKRFRFMFEKTYKFKIIVLKIAGKMEKDSELGEILILPKYNR